MPHLVANPKEILLLAKGLLEDAQKISELNEQMKQDLVQVSKTWLDDGIIEVNDCVDKVNKALDERIDNIGYIVNGLVTYAEALKKTI